MIGRHVGIFHLFRVMEHGFTWKDRRESRDSQTEQVTQKVGVRPECLLQYLAHQQKWMEKGMAG
ncbi:MAG: hypothetical protein IT526_03090 [Nitrosomonas sp.]|nr:hypothetical protein [Nitrosomonas sp.]